MVVETCNRHLYGTEMIPDTETREKIDRQSSRVPKILAEQRQATGKLLHRSWLQWDIANSTFNFKSTSTALKQKKYVT